MFNHHTSEVIRLSELPSEVDFLGSAELGLDDAIESHSTELADDLLQSWRALGRAPSGPWLLNLVAASIRLEEFQRLWSKALNDLQTNSDGILLKSLLWASNAQPEFASELSAFMDQRLPRLVDLLGLHQTLRYVVTAALDDTQRDTLLHRLLDHSEVKAAEHLAEESSRITSPLSALLRGYQILKAIDPYGTQTQRAMAGAIRSHPEDLKDDIGRLVNDDGTEVAGYRFQMADELRRAITLAMSPSLMDAIAEDALRRDANRHDTLASRVHFLRVSPEIVTRRVRDTLSREDCVVYSAGLLRLYLSKERVDAKTKAEIARLAETLFDKHGKVDRDRALEKWNVRSVDREPEIYHAVALMREIGDPPPPPDVGAILENLCQYPRTLEALGNAFDTWVRDNPNDFTVATWYEERAEDLYANLGTMVPRDSEALRAIAWSHRRLERALSFRSRWEERFQTFRERGLSFGTKLRTEEETWLEAMIGARLLSGGFEIDYEPELAWPGGPNLDYLVRDPDAGHDFFVEILRLGRRPDEVFDRARVSFGGEPKGSMLNKFRKQLREGSQDPCRPIVLAVQVRSALELSFSLPNSLYGVLQFGWKVGSRGTLTEGVQRGHDTGLFSEGGFDVISGVLAFTQENPEEPYLTGRMFWPLKKPRYPLSLRQYVLLRDALFGRLPSTDVERMATIPTITKGEAEELVRSGVDSPHVIALGQVDPSHLNLPQERIEKLAREIGWLERLQVWGQIELLKTARGIDLAPLFDAGIRTLPQLLRADKRPEGFPEGNWHGLRSEAAKWTSRPNG